MELTVIITAGGIGKRMNSSIPKQFLLLRNRPLLMHTIDLFHKFDPQAQIIITLPSDWWKHWSLLCKKYDFRVPITLIKGGIERYDSIKNALPKAKGEIIAVHDGVRPLASFATIEQAILLARQKGSGIPVLPLKESIRKGDVHLNSAQNRNDFFTVQTPQCFKSAILKKAYEQNFSASITDDASLVEQSGSPIFLTEGNEENIKITTPFDLQIAEFYLKNTSG